jgi:regulator of replication initiation timing
MEKINLTPEELSKLQESNDKVADIVASLGQIEIQISLLHKNKESLLTRFHQLELDQDQLAKELTQKYGDGTIDITSGEFTKA